MHYGSTEDKASPVFSRFKTELSPRAARPVVPLPVIAGLIVGLALIPGAFFCLGGFYDGLSAQYMTGEAANLLKQHNPQGAIETIRRSALTRHGKLTAEQQELLNSALFQQAQTFRNQHFYSQAAELLGQITPQYKDYGSVQKDLAELKKQVGAPATKATEGAPAARSAASKGGSAGAPHLPSAVSGNGSNADTRISGESKKRMASSDAQADSAATPQTTTQSQPPPSSPAPDSIEKAPTNLPAGDSSSNSTGPQPDQPAQSPQAKALPHFAHRDVVRYNELLAAYFSGNGNGKEKEPPSLNEWLAAGKPNF